MEPVVARGPLVAKTPNEFVRCGVHALTGNFHYQRSGGDPPWQNVRGPIGYDSTHLMKKSTKPTKPDLFAMKLQAAWEERHLGGPAILYH